MAINAKLRTYDDRKKLSPEIFPLVDREQKARNLI
jgi:hypothetical protein